MSTVDKSILFQTLTVPVNTLLDEPEIAGISDSAHKLTFPHFVRLMLYLCLRAYLKSPSMLQQPEFWRAV